MLNEPTVNKPSEGRFWRKARILLDKHFNLRVEMADEQEVISSVRKNSEFRGANLWTLIFAIFIASIGLNINSPVVIIGAMLISPLMGPVMGIGVGLAITDFALLKKGGRNLLRASLISAITSSIYFWLTPLHEAQSELLARTMPATWDVLVAFFGGLAGIVGATRKEKSNVIAGVAIATALMPPLCTAGFGIATGNWYFVLGAFYLYFINCVFICLSTYLMIRYLRFRHHRYEDTNYKRKVLRYILLITLITLVPSIYLSFRIVKESIFESNARRFVNDNFHFPSTQILHREFVYNMEGSKIDLLLIGEKLSDSTVKVLRSRLTQYRLYNTDLVLRQGIKNQQNLDFSQVKASILADINAAEPTPVIVTVAEKSTPDLSGELHALNHDIVYYSAGSMPFTTAGSDKTDTTMVVVLGVKKRIATLERKRLYDWLKQRLGQDSINLILQEQK
ncbi:TIGR00341 family protein [Chitinophaga jiangningensis]|uniref:TIGR00341 family protein n=1 Tax=Chitinophaga jiangningensis TaxID=1419482 RepID=A0A1M7K4M7_9BACT|nr:TIGR00341 family protein [Chitinophaga jiangningensis]SHM60216.1 TIGR00341 family protein [Chitinophaga jiangningensis]